MAVLRRDVRGRRHRPGLYLWRWVPASWDLTRVLVPFRRGPCGDEGRLPRSSQGLFARGRQPADPRSGGTGSILMNGNLSWRSIFVTPFAMPMRLTALKKRAYLKGIELVYRLRQKMGGYYIGANAEFAQWPFLSTWLFRRLYFGRCESGKTLRRLSTGHHRL